MRKIIILALSSILLTPSAWALTTTVPKCPSGYSWCGGYYANPGNNDKGCCIPNSQLCTSTSCGGDIGGILVPCKGQPCEGQLMTWMEYVTGKLTRCPEASESATCEYRCNPDGYYRTSIGGGSAMRCAECPSNATCSDGVSVCCNQGHYPVKNVYMAPGLTGQITEYTCPSCPGYLRYLSATSPTGMYVPGTTDANLCPTGIGACYIPSGTYSGDIAGRFQVIGKCHYQES